MQCHFLRQVGEDGSERLCKVVQQVVEGGQSAPPGQPTRGVTVETVLDDVEVEGREVKGDKVHEELDEVGEGEGIVRVGGFSAVAREKMEHVAV